jgi:ribonucleoside-diphosphate reductase alpha chain
MKEDRKHVSEPAAKRGVKAGAGPAVKKAAGKAAGKTAAAQGELTLDKWLGADNKLGHDIFIGKYRYDGETLAQSFDRFSGGNRELGKLIIDKVFIPGGRILANRGLEKTGRKITLSNCYVVAAPEDNIESIFDCAKKLARTYSYGGGCGIDISKLSPKGARINNAAKETSGAISFMDLYGMITQLIGQNGRRGALMISMSCEHPDIEDFIRIKTDLNKVTKANISVRITDEFMDAVIGDKPFTLRYLRESTGQLIEKKIMARELFRLMAQTNWDYAEPGALFWNRIEKWNLLSNTKSFQYAGTNPCAEEPLPAGGSCLLGSMNLAAFVKDPFTDKAKFDYTAFKKAVRICVRGLNEILDEGLELHPLQEQRDSVRDWRQIGLGIMGLADMLIMLGVRYGSKKSLDLCDRIGFAMADTAINESAQLAKKFGAYPKCEIDSVTTTPFFLANTTEETRALAKQYGLHNSQLLTIAPTGTISTMLEISGGIEPFYSYFFTRKTESLHGKDVYYKEYMHTVKQYMDAHGIEDETKLPDFFTSAMQLDYKDRIAMQSVWQKHIDASISSTVNVPNNFTVDQVIDLYVRAYKAGLKGVTLYRDGCARTGILTAKKKDNLPKVPRAGEGMERGEVVSISENEIGLRRKIISGCGSLHVAAYFDPKNGALMEIFLNKGSTGGCMQFMNGLSRMISLAARAGVDVNTICDQLNSCGSCPSYAIRSAQKHDTSKGACCPMAVGNVLLEMYEEMQKYIKDGAHPLKGVETLAAEEGTSGVKTQTAKETAVEKLQEKTKKLSEKEKEDEDAEKISQGICPECGEPLVHEGGCIVCKSCGWSKCL